MNKISYFFLFTFFSNNLLASPFDKFKSGFDSMKGKYDKAKSKVDEAKAKVDEVKGKVDEVEAEVEDAKAKINDVKDDVRGVIRDVDNKYKEITGGGDNNEEYKGGTNTNKEQMLGQNDKEYVEWVKRLQNLSPLLRSIVSQKEHQRGKRASLFFLLKVYSKNITIRIKRYAFNYL